MSPRSWADDDAADGAADGAAEPFWRTAAPTRPRPVTGGIQINASRGAVARTTWSARFLAVLEAAGVGGRLARGRTYARRGQTVSLQVDGGAATARVQGSAARPYRVRIGVPTLGKAQWAAVLDALATDASLTAALLAGELPREVEETFAAQGVALLPSGRDDLTMDCTCPDVTVPCKHLAAVFYLLAERFDADPFALLALRGRDRETVLDELRDRLTHAAAAPTLPLDPAVFYGAGGPPTLPVGPRTPPDALLDQVPAFPLAVRGGKRSGHDASTPHSVRGGRPAPDQGDAVDLLRPLYRALGQD